jgi:ribosome-binding factor A
MSMRTDKVNQLIKELAANFLEREASNVSLITATGCEVSPDLKKAVVYFTVLPESKEKSALDFSKRMRGDFRDYLKKNLEMRVIPFIDFEIDKGEKNRQRIEQLLAQKD